ncbi:hypothetical protein F4810DRAFT_656497 [Camillea tinctor]|nr:hypothetical protein F4810DRAFT_656497 [Camillea tinctor]
MAASMPLSYPPFDDSIRDNQGHEFSLTSLLPATFRTKDGHIIVPNSSIIECLEKELLVERLDKAKDWLWLSGRPVPPRALHHQVLLRRSIVVTEQPELHLVWTHYRIFIKPLPLFLLDKNFWKEHLCIPPSKSETQLASESSSADDLTRATELAKAARGLLYSYTALIAHPSDFEVARSHGLIPEGLKWPEWKSLAQQVVRNHSYANISPRYRYRELRLSRLNKIYRLRYGYLIRGFSRVESPSFYAEFFADNFGKMAAVLGYVVIVLTAMQVGLATEHLRASDAFQNASYGFTVFSITAPIGAAVALLLIFVCIFIANWSFTRKDGHRRRELMDRWDQGLHNRTDSDQEPIRENMV